MPSDFDYLLRPPVCVRCGCDLGVQNGSSHGHCDRCRFKVVRAGGTWPPDRTRTPLPAGSYGYSQAWGTAQVTAADQDRAEWTAKTAERRAELEAELHDRYVARRRARQEASG